VSDWIEEFIAKTTSIRSPEIFRLWSAIGTVAAALERRVWTSTDVAPLYPNLFTILVGPPACGKTNSVKESRKMLAPITGMKLGPDNPTPASFMDELSKATVFGLNGQNSGPSAAMTVLCEEFGVLIPKYDDSFFATLSKLYDNPSMYTAPRRTSVSIKIENPTINILGCATPPAIGSLPESAWGEGCTSRIIFLYGTKPNSHRDAFKKRIDSDMKELQNRISEIFSDIHGEFEWEEPARLAYNHWYNDEQMAPVPTYGRLVNYNGRRDTHVMKLSMISAVSAEHGLTITLDDFIRGRKWLLDAEQTMPDVFRAITQKSDAQLLQDLHYWMYTEYSKVARDKRNPIPDGEVWKFLENKTTSDKIPGLFKAAESSGRMRKNFGTNSWIPNPFNGVEE
jgi:hypothetical protein